MKKSLLIISSLLLVLLLASCVISPKEKDVYDIKVTISGLTDEKAKYNGTFYINSTEAVKEPAPSALGLYGVYEDSKCTNKVFSALFIYLSSNDGGYPCRCSFIDNDSNFIISTWCKIYPEIIKTVSNTEMVFKPGSCTTSVPSSNITISFEVFRETSFALTEVSQ